MNIIELAKEANGEPAGPGGVDWTWDELERFAKLVAAHEREACAKVCEHQPHWAACAAAIRARGQA
jgi:hypothetical protein